jgi:uncharacterized protein
MKNLITGFLLIGLTAVSSAQTQSADPTPGISVVGVVDRKVSPDTAEVTFSIVEINEDVDVAFNKGSKSLESVYEVLKNHNVPTKDIKVGGAWLYTVWDGSHKLIQNKKYRFQRALTVTLTNLPEVEAILRDLVKSGVSEISRLEYKSSQFAQHRSELRLEAIKAAKAKAIAMAHELGAKVGKPLKVSEDNIVPQPWQINRYSNMVQPGAAQPDDEPGRITLSATVHITFALE